MNDISNIFNLNSKCIDYLEQAEKKCFAPHLKRNYQQAIASLKAYPLPLKNISETTILKGITQSIYNELDQMINIDKSLKETKNSSSKSNRNNNSQLNNVTNTVASSNVRNSGKSTPLQRHFHSLSNSDSQTFSTPNHSTSTLDQPSVGSTGIIDLCSPSPVSLPKRLSPLSSPLPLSITNNHHNTDNNHKRSFVDDSSSTKNTNNTDDDVITASQTSKKPKQTSKRAYKPRKGTSAFAVMTVLAGSDTPLDKIALKARIEERKLCSKKFAWKSVLDLVNRELICVVDENYKLTADGVELAQSLNLFVNHQPSSQQTTTTQQKSSTTQQKSSTTVVSSSIIERNERNVDNSVANNSNVDEFQLSVLPRQSITRRIQSKTIIDSFDTSQGEIVLLIDNREVLRHQRLSQLLARKKVLFETRVLSLGDMMFVLRVKSNKPNLPYEEYVMDYVVERKRIDDFMASITDGRYDEQKYRLRRCGAENVAYLVEGDLNASITVTSTGWDPILKRKKVVSKVIPSDVIRNAMLSTHVRDGFTIRNTASLDDSAAYLQSVYDYMCEHRPMLTIPIENSDDENICRHIQFKEFQNVNSKNSNSTVGVLYCKQLMQLRGCSTSRALSIAKKFPSVKALISAYRRLETKKEREMMLAKLIVDGSSTKIGGVLSKAVYAFYAQSLFDE